MMISDLDIELLAPQAHENIAIIPLKTEKNYSLDLLTLKKGLSLGLVSVKECEQSQVNTLVVENKAVTPLILIDGEEVVGGDQNRIVNSTVIIAAKSTMKIPVSCTEQNRWGYKSEFKDSEYIANFKTRRAKECASRSYGSVQHAVWSAIDCVEEENSFASPTKALSESYDYLKVNHSEVVKSFKIEKNQNGILVIVDGEIRGFELFLNSEIYGQFHEKILRSYLIDSKIGNATFSIDVDDAKSMIDDAKYSAYEKRETEGLEETFEFENDYGLGVLSTYNNEVIHWSYFKKSEDTLFDEVIEDVELESQI